MKDIIIIGAGGFARETRFLLEDINFHQPTYRFLGYVVSDVDILSDTDSKDEVVGNLSWIREYGKSLKYAIGIGNPDHRLTIGKLLTAEFPNTEPVTLIHPNLVYDRSSCRIGKGVIICANCVLTVNVHIHDFAMLNLACTVGHEAVIGEGVVMNPTVNVSGGVIIGDRVLIGTGAQILQYLTIGSDSKVGAGACVRKDVEPGDIVAGVPAKSIGSSRNRVGEL